ncbi:MAG: hypothetical protein R3F60_32220 [bacterium]
MRKLNDSSGPQAVDRALRVVEIRLAGHPQVAARAAEVRAVRERLRGRWRGGEAARVAAQVMTLEVRLLDGEVDAATQRLARAVREVVDDGGTRRCMPGRSRCRRRRGRGRRRRRRRGRTCATPCTAWPGWRRGGWPSRWRPWRRRRRPWRRPWPGARRWWTPTPGPRRGAAGGRGRAAVLQPPADRAAGGLPHERALAESFFG